MRVRFSYRTEKGRLPDAVTLMETTRRLHDQMKQNPAAFWEEYKGWVKPMNQLQNGLFISITEETEDFQFSNYFNKDSPLRLEYHQLVPNYAKIMFEYKTCICIFL